MLNHQWYMRKITEIKKQGSYRCQLVAFDIYMYCVLISNIKIFEFITGFMHAASTSDTLCIHILMCYRLTTIYEIIAKEILSLLGLSCIR